MGMSGRLSFCNVAEINRLVMQRMLLIYAVGCFEDAQFHSSLQIRLRIPH